MPNTPSSGAGSSAKASSGPTKANSDANAIEKKIAVSSTEPASEANTGARHQLCRRRRLKTVTSSSCAARKAAPEALAMRTSRPAVALEVDQAERKQQRRHDDRADDGSHEADENDAARDGRAVAAVGKVGDQEGEGIGEGAPGQHVGERQAADEALHRKLHKHVRGHDDKRHGDDERQMGGEPVHFFILGDGTSRTPRARRSA